MRWLDLNPDVHKWNSEETVINYICKSDGKSHRYFIDFSIQFLNGKTVLVEVKPNIQTKPPKESKNRNKYLKEAVTYAKNISKWEAAKKFADANNAEFQIWDENVLESIGIRITKNYPKTKKKKTL